MYADTDYYSNSYYNADSEPVIPAAEQLMYLRYADAMLNTFFAANKPSEPYPEEVKLTCCAIADIIYIDGQTDGIASENTDGYSVTYEKGTTSTRQKAYDAASMYLADTGLLYRGIG